MVAELLKYISVYLSSMLKFIAGPTMGAAMGLSFLETTVVTVAGMMTTVVIISFFGPQIRIFINRRFKRKRRKFSRRNRMFVTFWKNYGIPGVAFLTPVLFSPVLGSLMINSVSRISRTKVITYMLISAIFWSLTFIKMIQLLEYGVAMVRL